MQKAILSFTIFFHSLIVLGQVAMEKVEITSFPNFKLEERAIPIDILGFDSTGYYLLYGNGKFGTKRNSIVKFNLDLTPSGKKTYIINPELEPNIQSVKLIKLKDELVHILVKNESQSRTYYYEKISLNDLSISPRHFMTKVVVSDGNMKKSAKTILASPDSSKIVLVYTLPVKKIDPQKN